MHNTARTISKPSCRNSHQSLLWCSKAFLTDRRSCGICRRNANGQWLLRKRIASKTSPITRCRSSNCRILMAANANTISLKKIWWSLLVRTTLNKKMTSKHLWKQLQISRLTSNTTWLMTFYKSQTLTIPHDQIIAGNPILCVRNGINTREKNLRLSPSIYMYLVGIPRRDLIINEATAKMRSGVMQICGYFL